MSKEAGKLIAGGVGKAIPHSAELPKRISPNKSVEACAANAATQETSAGANPTAETRWWLTVSIGVFRIRALYDPGASCTVICEELGTRIAEACGREIKICTGPGARVADGRLSPIRGYVDLPFEVASVKRDVRVAIMNRLDADCYLGANFMRVFQTVFDPTRDQLLVKVADKTVDLEVAAVSSTAVTTLASIGLADLRSDEERRLQERPKKDPAIGPSSHTWGHCPKNSATGPSKCSDFYQIRPGGQMYLTYLIRIKVPLFYLILQFRNPIQHYFSRPFRGVTFGCLSSDFSRLRRVWEGGVTGR